MQPLEEKDSSPLEDTEITRLINVSRELGYKKQDKIPERNLVDFKPTTITQIAVSSSERTQATSPSEANQTTEINEKRNQGGSEKNLDNVSSNNVNNSKPIKIDPIVDSDVEHEEINETSRSSLETGLDVSEGPAQLEKKEAKVINEIDDPEVDSKEDISDEKAPVEDPTVASKGTDMIDTEEAKKEGIEIGKKIAFAEIENEQQKIIETFRLIIDNIQKKQTIDKTELTQSILETVTRLASERAGIMIENNSGPFSNKIASFVEKIEEASKNLILNLNPRDANLIKKNLEESLDNKEIEIRENSELFRGDFILQMGSVEIGDLISEQISISEDNEDEILKDSGSNTDTGREFNKETKSVPTPALKGGQTQNKPKGDENDK